MSTTIDYCCDCGSYDEDTISVGEKYLCPCCRFDDYQKLLSQLDAKQAQLDMAVEALKFYSNEDNWAEGDAVYYDVVDRDNLENGKKAREVLNELKRV